LISLNIINMILRFDYIIKVRIDPCFSLYVRGISL
jgi:hypothetical protein